MRGKSGLAIVASLTLALVAVIPTYTFADNLMRTVTRTTDRASVIWSYALPTGERVYAKVHRCDCRSQDSRAAPGTGRSESDPHLAVRIYVYEPTGAIEHSVIGELPAGPMNLGTSLKGVRIRGSGTAVRREFHSGVVTEVPVALNVDMQLTGVDQVAYSSSTWTSYDRTNNLTWTWTHEIYRRDALMIGAATVDGQPIAPADCVPQVALKHEVVVGVASK
jgi:hypothetical protein